MSQTASEVNEKLVGMAAQLSGTSVEEWTEGAEQRQEWRRPIEVDCQVCCFRGPYSEPVFFDGKTRDLAFGGIAVVVKLDRPERANRPVEVTVNMADGTQRHLAGLVAYCRESAGRSFDLGVDVRAVGQNAVLAHDVASSVELYDWFQEALDQPE